MIVKEWNDAFKDFTPEELACPETGGYKFHPGFPEALQSLRDMYAKPIHPNSCCRSEEYNNSLANSSPISLHIYDGSGREAQGTCAIDVRIADSSDRHEFIKLALVLGFSCYFIGGNPVNIHLDQRVLLGEPVRFW